MTSRSSHTIQGAFVALACCAYVSTSACNAFDDPPLGERTVRVVPEDSREPFVSDSPLLPVSGGTLLSLGSGSALVVGDPDRDRLSFVTGSGVSEVTLARGSHPGRMANLGEGRVATVLRGTGEVVAIDSATKSELWRASVCNAPRGLDYAEDEDTLYVACVDGTLASLSGSDGSVTTTLDLESDLRDVVVADAGIYVSRFRSAEVLFVFDGKLERKIELPDVVLSDEISESERRMTPTVAWKMFAAPSGGVTVVHQRSTTDPVATEATADDDGDEERSLGGASGASPYGGGGGCDSIVIPAISEVQSDGTVRTSQGMVGMTLVVDAAYLNGGEEIVVANAGPRDLGAPTVSIQTISAHGDVATPAAGPSPGSALGVFPRSILVPANSSGPTPISCAFEGGTVETEPVTAVTLHEGNLMVQLPRNPSILRFSNSNVFGGERVDIGLGGERLRDTGHDLFHTDSGAGIACASCHPEGTDDGHVWVFEGLGERRTQNLAVPLESTAPFHWDGELPTVASLMDEVFVGRMGGVFQSEERLQALEHWLFNAPQPVRLREADAAVARGKDIFESAEVGCVTCHTGTTLTDNKSYDVGTGEALQVPSLVGVSAHPPFMHTGCAQTLAARFESPKCGGGDSHGRTSQLDDEQLGDLIAYLESL